jgi:hypothetical protein
MYQTVSPRSLVIGTSPVDRTGQNSGPGSPSREEDGPIPPPLPSSHRQGAVEGIEVGEVETAQLGAPETATIEHGEQGRVSPPRRRRVLGAHPEQRRQLVLLDGSALRLHPGLDVLDGDGSAVSLGVHQAQPPGGLEHAS